MVTDINNLQNASSNVQTAANNIVQNNLYSQTTTCQQSLTMLQTNFSNLTVVAPFGSFQSPYSVRSMNQYVNNAAVAKDFTNLFNTAQGLHNASKAILNAIGSSGQQNTVLALTQMQVFLNQWIIDVSTMGSRIWNRGFERWQFVWGGYWLNFSLTIILLIFFAVMLGLTCYALGNVTHNVNVFACKVLLNISAFFILFYIIMIIIMMGG